jgi:hypothetical protein
MTREKIKTKTESVGANGSAAGARASAPYRFTLSLNILNHLGINLYSNVPAVLAETVANAWDADAEQVDIEINLGNDIIKITDNGHGMDQSDMNEKYLTVGYQRREIEGGLTQRLRRPVMGRKGIGKLSLFSIAEIIEVQSVKEGSKNGFVINVPEIRRAIKKDKGKQATYNPEPVQASDIKIAKGTRIILRKLSKRLHRTEAALRKRLARRFTVIGADHKFEIKLNNKPITVEDRDYLSRLQCLWTYGSDEYSAECKKLEKNHSRPNKISAKHTIAGWIGTVKEVGSLRDDDESLNRIVIMVRGKLAQEDILESLGLTGIFTKYVCGEIHADFFDTNAEPDIATSSRQKLVEDDPRYLALKKFLEKELATIRQAWNKFRDKTGSTAAQEIPAIKEWFEALRPDARRAAERLFGRINQMPLESDSNRRTLMKHAVLAFESFNYKQNLSALDQLTPENISALIPIFQNLDDIEATVYHQIVAERIAVIGVLRNQVNDNALERAIQQHLFKHLWLLDPAWERATGTEYMEQRVDKEFKKIAAKLTKEEKEGRVDIKYATTSGKHLIIELKRAKRIISSSAIIDQTARYRNALRKLLSEVNRGSERIEVICVVGQFLQDWAERDGRAESEELLAAKDIRVVMYQELIEGAYKAYKAYLDRSSDANRVLALLQAIESDERPKEKRKRTSTTRS